MENETKQILNDHQRLINIIRCYPNIERPKLANYLGVSLPTLSNYLQVLKNSNILLNKSVDGIEVGKDSLIINPEFGLYAGISIGGSQIKITLIKMDFSALSGEEFDNLCQKTKIFHKKVKEEGNSKFDFIPHKKDDYGYVYINTPQEFEKLQNILDEIFDNCIEINKYLGKIGCSLLGIGLSITGAVDNISKKIIKAYNLKCLDDWCPVSYDTIISRNRISYFSEHNVEISLENIAKAAVVSEKFNLYNCNNPENVHKTKKNIACIYLGSGIGAGLVLDNSLYRGTSNFSEIGHIEVRDPDFFENNKGETEDRCECGNKHCLEFKIRHNVFGCSMDAFRGLTSEQLKDLITNSDDKDYKLRLLGYYIGTATNILTNILNLDLVIYNGKLTALLDDFDLWRYINVAIKNNKVTYTTSDCERIKSSFGALAPAIGSAICSSYIGDTDIVWN